jgi:hypothetical protein
MLARSWAYKINLAARVVRSPDRITETSDSDLPEEVKFIENQKLVIFLFATY